MKNNVLKNKSFLFAIRIVNMYKFLAVDKKEFVLSKQLLRSGTSVGANVREAEFGQSKPDFIHKLSIAQKEANETEYWLELLFQTEYLTKIQFDSIQPDIIESLKLITTSIKTAKNNYQ